MRKIFIFITISIINISCMDKYDNRVLLVENNSKENIYTLIYYDELNVYKSSPYEFSGLFKDSLLLNTKKEINRPSDWKSYSKILDNNIRLYIINKDSVDKYGWEGIYKHNIYNKKYLLDMDVLDSLNWKIEYNGD